MAKEAARDETLVVSPKVLAPAIPVRGEPPEGGEKTLPVPKEALYPAITPKGEPPAEGPSCDFPVPPSVLFPAIEIKAPPPDTQNADTNLAVPVASLTPAIETKAQAPEDGHTELAVPPSVVAPALNPNVQPSEDTEGELKPLSFRGGCDTAREPALLPTGAFSMIQNMRQKHPGMVKRPGCAKLHATNDGTNEVTTVFLFSKGKVTERHFYAQMGDDDVLEASTLPPGIGGGAFGTEAFSGTASSKPASWSVLNDMLLFSNGVDQHQIYPGNTTPVSAFIVYKGGGAIPDVPEMGEDYSSQVSDGDASTVAVLDSLGDLAADFDCIFIRTAVPAKSFTWTVSAVNGTASVMKMKYWKGSWTVQAITDNTADGGATLAKSGSMTFTAPTDIQPKYLFGKCGWWYQFYLDSGDLDAEVEVSAVTFEADWQAIQNVWDSVPVDIIEAQHYDQSAAVYKSYGASAIEIDSFAATNDQLYFCAADLCEAIYIDVGKKPNTTASTTINALYYWNGAAFASVGTVNDGTAGMSHSGWVTFPRVAAQPLQFGKNKTYGYWYYFTTDKTLNDDVIISMSCQPYFTLADLGKGLANTAWKDRMVYAFSLTPEYIHITPVKDPMVLNGDDYAYLAAGDGRKNKVVCIKKFHNELMVWQEEKGRDGGCLTLFEGYSPQTFGRLVLSTKLGTFSAKSAVVIEDLVISTRTDESVKTIAAFISHYGVYITDGRVPQAIHDLGPGNSIANYFDPTKTTTCIRAGYEDKMWIAYDAAFNCLRLGLVCGSSATTCNIFPVFDLQDRTWSFDSLGQALTCMETIEAASGNIPLIQVGGGTADGYLYLLNSGADDVAAAVDAYATMEIDAGGLIFLLRELILRMKVQSAGNCTLTPYINSVAQTAVTLAMTAESASQAERRHRKGLNLTGEHVSLKFQNATSAQSLYLIDAIARLVVDKNR